MALSPFMRCVLQRALWVAIGICPGSAIAGPAEEEITAAEGELRAAVTVGVLRFTSWLRPFPAAMNEIAVCLLGKPMGEAFLLPASGVAPVGDKQIRVQVITNDDWGHCQVFVIGSGTHTTLFAKLARHAEENEVLTVCDGCNAECRDLAMISLKLEDQRIGFNVNLKKALAANIRLDASLLELAARVIK